MAVGFVVFLATTATAAVTPAAAAAAAATPNAIKLSATDATEQNVGEVPAALGKEVVKLFRPFLS